MMPKDLEDDIGGRDKEVRLTNIESCFKTVDYFEFKYNEIIKTRYKPVERQHQSTPINILTPDLPASRSSIIV